LAGLAGCSAPPNGPASTPALAATSLSAPGSGGAPNQNEPTAAPAAAATPVSAVVSYFTVLQEHDISQPLNSHFHYDLIAFLADQHVPFQVRYVDGYSAPATFYDTIAGAAQAGTPPDLLYAAKDTFRMSRRGLLQPVDDVIGQLAKSLGDPLPGQKLASYVDGHWFAVPFFSQIEGYWARRSWFSPAKLDPGTTRSVQDWLTAAVHVTDPAQNRWGWGQVVGTSAVDERGLGQIVFGAGGRLVDANGEPAFDSAETVAAFQWLADLYRTGSPSERARPTDLASWDDRAADAAWLAGNLGFTYADAGLLNDAVGQAPKVADDTFLVATPRAPVARAEAVVMPTSVSLYLFAGSKYPDVARAVSFHLLSQTFQKSVWVTSPGCVAPAYTWGWAESEIVHGKNGTARTYQRSAQAEPFAPWLPGPAPQQWITDAGDAGLLGTTLAAILKGASAKDAVASAQATLQTFARRQTSG
jgi:multiple sugar transport system substrate-binding protein